MAAGVNVSIADEEVIPGAFVKATGLFIEALEAGEVEYLWGISGAENLDLLNSARDSAQIQLILARHEKAAGFIMAATY